MVPGTGLTWIKAAGRGPVKIKAAVIDREGSHIFTHRSRIGAALALAALGLVPPAAATDAARGQALYESRCGGCHTQSVHQREARKAATFEGVLAQISRWNAALGGDWNAEDIEDVAMYLNQRYYRYPCPASVCPPGRATLTPAATAAR